MPTSSSRLTSPLAPPRTTAPRGGFSRSSTRACSCSGPARVRRWCARLGWRACSGRWFPSRSCPRTCCNGGPTTRPSSTRSSSARSCSPTTTPSTRPTLPAAATPPPTSAPSTAGPNAVQGWHVLCMPSRAWSLTRAPRVLSSPRCVGCSSGSATASRLQSGPSRMSSSPQGTPSSHSHSRRAGVSPPWLFTPPSSSATRLSSRGASGRASASVYCGWWTRTPTTSVLGPPQSPSPSQPNSGTPDSCTWTVSAGARE
mmetsp:Transcript_35834/g.114181  ORF Transcript_35834/g.114181 Transcript_35834/m.114181 type:complete len:257 (+) Transcript_35834:150-920(+)